MKDQETVQETMNKVNRKLAGDVGALYAAVGESWWYYKNSYPQIEMYDEDGAHASEQGIEFAAKIIWETIVTDVSSRNRHDTDELRKDFT